MQGCAAARTPVLVSREEERKRNAYAELYDIYVNKWMPLSRITAAEVRTDVDAPPRDQDELRVREGREMGLEQGVYRHRRKGSGAVSGCGRGKGSEVSVVRVKEWLYRSDVTGITSPGIVGG